MSPRYLLQGVRIATKTPDLAISNPHICFKDIITTDHPPPTGENGNLIVSIKHYEGPTVYCTGPAHTGSGGITSLSCLAVLAFMPVDYGFKIFGPADDSTVDVVIPKTFGSGEHNPYTYITIFISLPKTRSLRHHVRCHPVQLLVQCSERPSCQLGHMGCSDEGECDVCSQRIGRDRLRDW